MSKSKEKLNGPQIDWSENTVSFATYASCNTSGDDAILSFGHRLPEDPESVRIFKSVAMTIPQLMKTLEMLNRVVQKFEETGILVKGDEQETN